MKKTNIILILFITLVLIIPNEIYAATNCSKLTTQTKCENKKSDGCTWGKTSTNNKKHCYTKSSVCSKKKNNSTCTKAGCNWGYNGSSTQYCYSESSSVTKTTTSSNSTSNSSSSNTTKVLNFCAKTSVIWQIVGWILLVFKIIVPLLLIIFGVVDLFKAVISSKDDEIKKSMKKLLYRAIAAITIFFIPTIVGIVMGLVVDFADSGAKADYEVCRICILNPNDCDTSKDAGKN